MSEKEAYPLHWPSGWKRTDYPEFSRFDTPLAQARDGLIRELEMLGATNIILSTNIELRLDGLPYASRRPPEDSGVAVYFKLDGQDQCIPCDKWYYVQDNLHAVELTVAALRGLERWGAKEMVNAAFRGFKALPEATVAGRPWCETLGVEPNASTAEVERAYKRLAREHHPDTGGSHEAFIELQGAYKQAIEAVSA